MESFNKQINTYLNFYNKTNRFKKGYEIDGNIVLTNCYSIVVLPFSANKKQMQRLNEMNIEIVKENEKKKKNTINDDFMIKQLKNFIEGFKNQNFCESINVENITSDLKFTDNISFSAKQIRNIQKIINGKCIFLSENNEQAISLTGKNGFAFLLGMRCY